MHSNLYQLRRISVSLAYLFRTPMFSLFSKELVHYSTKQLLFACYSYLCVLYIFNMLFWNWSLCYLYMSVHCSEDLEDPETFKRRVLSKNVSICHFCMKYSQNLIDPFTFSLSWTLKVQWYTLNIPMWSVKYSTLCCIFISLHCIS